MTGPEHYREAERLIASAADPYDVELTQAERNTIALGAQVHATLALAAFTADPEGSDVGQLATPSGDIARTARDNIGTGGCVQ